MKTTLLLFAALLISTIAFSQNSKKGYDHYVSVGASKKMNKAELIDAMAKDAPLIKELHEQVEKGTLTTKIRATLK